MEYGVSASRRMFAFGGPEIAIGRRGLMRSLIRGSLSGFGDRWPGRGQPGISLKLGA